MALSAEKVSGVFENRPLGSRNELTGAILARMRSRSSGMLELGLHGCVDERH